MLNLFLTILRRDLTLSLRRKSDLAQVIFFFAVVVTLVPLGVGAETNILRGGASRGAPVAPENVRDGP